MFTHCEKCMRNDLGLHKCFLSIQPHYYKQFNPSLNDYVVDMEDTLKAFGCRFV